MIGGMYGERNAAVAEHIPSRPWNSVYRPDPVDPFDKADEHVFCG